MDFVIPLLALTAMEIVLGIDNIVFITIVSGRLPESQQPLARKLGLALALLSRLALLGLLFYLVNDDAFKKPVFALTDCGLPHAFVEHMPGPEINESIREHLDEATIQSFDEHHFSEANGVSLKDLVLFIGGLFLVWKSVHEIHDELKPASQHKAKPRTSAFVGVLIQIALLDIVFSLDSVVTAVGMVEDLNVMVTAVVLSVIVMLIFAEPISRFVKAHPTVKMLALSFLILIGVMLIAEGVGAHIDKGYVYFAMFFALIVEMLNIGLRKKESADVVVG